jgi:hypothetical protein
MSNILTGDQVEAIVTPEPEFDSAFIDDGVSFSNIIYAQEVYLRPLMTVAFYDDYISQIGALPPDYETLQDKFIQFIVAYSSFGYTIKNTLGQKTDNQGVMTNRTEWSRSSGDRVVKNRLATLFERLDHYRQDLLEYLINNKSTYPLWDEDKVVYEMNARDFIKY